MESRLDVEDLLDRFECLGISREFMRFPEIAGTYSGPLFIVGSARCVWEDMEKVGLAKNNDTNFHVMCVNDMIMHYPGRVHHSYSNNHAYLPKWMNARRDQYLTRWEGKIHTHSNKIGGKWTWPWPGHGTSSLNACYTGIALGYEQIILCGVPLDNTGRYFEPPWMKSNFQNEIGVRDGRLKYWANAKDRIFKGRVKSVSGRTKELLGAP